MTSDPNLFISLSPLYVTVRIRPDGPVLRALLFKWRSQWWFLGVYNPCHQQPCRADYADGSNLKVAGSLVSKARGIFFLQTEFKEGLLERVSNVEYFCNIKIKFWTPSWLPGALPVSVCIRSSFTKVFWIPSGSDQQKTGPCPAKSENLSPELLFRSEFTSAVQPPRSFCFCDSLNSEPRLQELWSIPELASLSYVPCLLHSSPWLFLSSLTLESDLCDSLTLYGSSVSGHHLPSSQTLAPGFFCSSLSYRACTLMAQDLETHHF